MILGWEDHLDEVIATHSSILVWRIPWTVKPSGYSPWGCKESKTIKATEHAHMQHELVLETQKDSFLPFFLESFHVRETEHFCVPPCLAPSSARTEALLWRTLLDVALHLYPLISFHNKSVI